MQTRWHCRAPSAAAAPPRGWPQQLAAAHSALLAGPAPRQDAAAAVRFAAAAGAPAAPLLPWPAPLAAAAPGAAAPAAPLSRTALRAPQQELHTAAGGGTELCMQCSLANPSILQRTLLCLAHGLPHLSNELRLGRQLLGSSRQGLAAQDKLLVPLFQLTQAALQLALQRAQPGFGNSQRLAFVPGLARGRAGWGVAAEGRHGRRLRRRGCATTCRRDIRPRMCASSPCLPASPATGWCPAAAAPARAHGEPAARQLRSCHRCLHPCRLPASSHQGDPAGAPAGRAGVDRVDRCLCRRREPGSRPLTISGRGAATQRGSGLRDARCRPGGTTRARCLLRSQQRAARLTSSIGQLRAPTGQPCAPSVAAAPPRPARRPCRHLRQVRAPMRHCTLTLGAASLRPPSPPPPLVPPAGRSNHAPRPARVP